MARASKYKWEKGDVVGLYRVIKVLPKSANVKNLVIYSECLLCKAKVERWSNRMDSKHRGCTAPAAIEKTPEPVEDLEVFHVKPHTRKDGTVVVTDENGNVVNPDGGEDLTAGDLGLDQSVIDALNFDVDTYVKELLKAAENMDAGTKFTFITTLRRYVSLVHIARKLELKLANNGELTTLGSNGNQVANPLITQYKSVSAESNVTVRLLNNMIIKSGGDGETDPLLEALRLGGV